MGFSNTETPISQGATTRGPDSGGARPDTPPGQAPVMPSYAARPSPAPQRADTPNRARDKTATSTAPPSQPGQAADAFHTGGDWAVNPGAYENFWEQFGPGLMGENRAGEFYDAMKGEFQTPGMGEQHIQGALGQFNLPSAAEQEYGRAADAGLGPYYDRAKERTAADLNKQLAARGSFGATAGIGQIGQAMTDLEAERANREADFRLQAAQAADTSRLGRILGGGEMAGAGQRLGLGRMDAGLGAAMGADSLGISRFGTAAGTAMGVQGAKEGRVGEFINKTMMGAGAGAGMIGQTWASLQGADRELFESQMALKMGIPAEAFRQMMADQAAKRQAMGQVWEGIGVAGQGAGSIAGGLTGGGGGQSNAIGGSASQYVGG